VALTQASLSTKIETEIKAQFGAPAAAGQLKKFCDAVAKAVVDEIQSNAVVAVTVTTVTPGVGTAPGTGTIS